MSVPKTSIDEKNRPVPGKDKVRFARKPTVMKTESQPPREKPSPDDLFDLGIFPTYAGHYPASFFLGDDVCHG
ncbi:hypothetical protein GMSM_43400 [Geomonas sp. Red276]